MVYLFKLILFVVKAFPVKKKAYFSAATLKFSYLKYALNNTGIFYIFIKIAIYNSTLNKTIKPDYLVLKLIINLNNLFKGIFINNFLGFV